MSIEVIRLCNHCGNKTPQEIVHVFTSHDSFDFSDKDEDFFECYYFYCICKTCNQPLIYYQHEFETDKPNVWTASCIYPRTKEYSQDYIPKTIRDTYNEASKIRRLSPNGYALLARKVVELICKDIGAKGNKLIEKIKSLSDDGVIPKTLFDMFENIRFLGNVSAHEDSVTVENDEARIVGEFIDAILEYIYVAPNKIKKLEQAIEAKYKKGKEKKG